MIIARACGIASLVLGLAFGVIAQADRFQGEGKGTIGIVCIDLKGTVHFWNAENQVAYDTCMDEVIGHWIREESASSGAGQPSERVDLIQGMGSFRQSIQRSNAR